MQALVVGGTGPTGHFIVNGLRERGYEVAILHSGRHELAENPDDIEHIHTDAYSPSDFRDAIEGRSFDLCIAAYGRLRSIAQTMVGRCEQFVSIGGVPAYRGYMNPSLLDPAGLPVPTPENATLIGAEDTEDSKSWRIVRTEESVFEHQPRATHFRYPLVYGPHQLMPREWCLVRRILEGRRQLILPDDGLMLQVAGYAGNLAHAVLLAVDQPDVAAGQVYNCGDEETLTLRQVAELVAAALNHEWEIVSMPYALAVPARPMVAQPLGCHRVLDLAKLKRELGYRDRTAPREALAHTARWLAEHPCEPGGMEEAVLQDPFDYAAEDRLIAAWRKAIAAMPDPGFATEPGYTLSYTGPGGRASSKDFE
jgi:nucleoside-diphosphate-sugar epimerase